MIGSDTIKDQIREDIHTYRIPRSTVANLCGLYLSDLCSWLNNRGTLNPVKIERVRETVASIVEVLEATTVLKFDLRDPDNVRRLIFEANKYKSQAATLEEQAQFNKTLTETDAADVFNMR